MDFKGLIDFNKYTVALASVGFVYTLEKFVPMPTFAGRLLVLALLITFLASAILGVAIFAVSTGALHGNPERKARAEKRIAPLGIWHTVFLCIGMIALAVMLSFRVMAAPEPIAKPQCCCTHESSTSQK